MTLPKGWIANLPAPEASVPGYTGDPNHYGNPRDFGPQPEIEGGTVGSIPVMSLTADALASICGDPERA